MDIYPKALIVNLLGDNKIEEAIEIISANAPKSLFKYRAGTSINEYSGKPYDIEVLEQQKLWMSQALQLDDPYDCAVLIKEDMEEVIEKLSDKYDKFKNPKYLNDVRVVNQDTRETALVCSLSENGTDIDMWTRYANCGKGFCIEYNFEELFEKHKILFPVTYGNIVKSINDFSDKQKVYIDTLFKKTDKLNWSTQEEWRIVRNATKHEKENHGALIDTPKPIAIYFGYHIDKELENAIKLLCQNNNIDLYKMSLSSKKVELIKEKVMLHR